MLMIEPSVAAFGATRWSFRRKPFGSLGVRRHSSARHHCFKLFAMQLTPLIAVHMTAALTALTMGPIVIWMRRGATQRPKLHRALGYAWVTCMVAAAVSSLFIRDYRLPNIQGYTLIHLFVPMSALALFRAFRCLYQGNIHGHRQAMVALYVSGCLIAGAFTLLPHRYLGGLLTQFFAA
jgi:uncharacterized membrane protein